MIRLQSEGQKQARFSAMQRAYDNATPEDDEEPDGDDARRDDVEAVEWGGQVSKGGGE